MHNNEGQEEQKQQQCANKPIILRHAEQPFARWAEGVRLLNMIETPSW